MMLFHARPCGHSHFCLGPVCRRSVPRPVRETLLVSAGQKPERPLSARTQLVPFREKSSIAHLPVGSPVARSAYRDPLPDHRCRHVVVAHEPPSPVCRYCAALGFCEHVRAAGSVPRRYCTSAQDFPQPLLSGDANVSEASRRTLVEWAAVWIL